MKDRLVRPELEKPFFIFKDSKENPEKYSKQIELADYPYLSAQTLAVAKQNLTWLPRVDSNDQPRSYTYPQFSLRRGLSHCHRFVALGIGCIVSEPSTYMKLYVAWLRIAILERV